MAAYLLGYDATKFENQAKIVDRLLNQIELAEGDDDKLVDRIGSDKLHLDLRFDVPPQEAIDYFKRKKSVTKKEFEKLSAEAKSSAFTISGIYKTDVLDGFKMEMTDALETGRSQKDIVKKFKGILSGAGHKELGDFHLETIFRTNMMTAYGIGKRRAMEEVAEDLPFWEYSAVGDDRTRPTHRALDGIVLPFDHPFWDTHFPPWEFNCRCGINATYALPENYNPNNPSGNAEIIYDDKETPVKAEWQTQVLDLQTQKFAGIPPQARLSSLGDFAKLRGQKPNYPTPPQVIEQENRVRFNDRETVAFYDRDGKKLFTKTGEPDNVKFDLTEAQEQILNRSVMTHNHPASAFAEKNGWQWKGVSFSLADIEIAIKLNLAEIRAVGNAFRYSLRPGKNGWSKKFKEELSGEYEKIRAKITMELGQKIVAGEIDFDFFNGVLHHLIWEELAKKYNLRYKRIED